MKVHEKTPVIVDRLELVDILRKNKLSRRFQFFCIDDGMDEIIDELSSSLYGAILFSSMDMTQNLDLMKQLPQMQLFIPISKDAPIEYFEDVLGCLPKVKLDVSEDKEPEIS